MAIPPELEVKRYASKRHFTIKSLSRTSERMVVMFKDAENLDKFLDDMVTHYSKRSGVDVDNHNQSIVFKRRES